MSSWDDFRDCGMKSPADDIRCYQKLASRINKGKPVKIVEVGTFAGLTAKCLAELGHEVHCVDHWLGSPHDRSSDLVEEHGPGGVHDAFRANLSEYLGKTVFEHVGSSKTIGEAWEPDTADMVIIDASHEYEDVVEDIEVWSKAVAPGGIICGHDYNSQGVKAAVDVIFGNYVQTGGFCVWWIEAGGEFKPQLGE
jgi:cephalosporin hydroxylase